MWRSPHNYQLSLGIDFDNEVDSDNNDCSANDLSDMSDVLLNCTISHDEILRIHAVKKLKNNKAPVMMKCPRNIYLQQFLSFYR